MFECVRSSWFRLEEMEQKGIIFLHCFKKSLTSFRGVSLSLTEELFGYYLFIYLFRCSKRLMNKDFCLFVFL